MDFKGVLKCDQCSGKMEFKHLGVFYPSFDVFELMHKVGVFFKNYVKVSSPEVKNKIYSDGFFVGHQLFDIVQEAYDTKLLAEVWDDITDAPKDGSRVIVTGINIGDNSRGRWVCSAVYKSASDKIKKAGWYADDFGHIDSAPTHFMDIPDKYILNQTERKDSK